MQKGWCSGEVPVRLRLGRKVVKVAQQAQDGDAKKLHAMLDFSKTLLDTRERSMSG